MNYYVFTKTSQISSHIIHNLRSFITRAAMSSAATETSRLHDAEKIKYASIIKRNEEFLKDLDVKGNDGIWMFGYGSLLWKTGFKYDRKVKGFIKGFVRRFWQESTDHRGTPEKPGRVVTLVESKDNEQKLWGFAYHVPIEHLAETLDQLNFREKGGYNLRKVKLFTDADDSEKYINVLLYIGEDDFTETISLDDTAAIISFAVGPSGPNKDYLFRLAQALRQENMASEDDQHHILLLEQRVNEILANNLMER